MIRVIAVDDNVHFLKGLNNLLSKNERFEVLNVYDSAESFLSNNEYYGADIILLDVEMPGMDGIELARQINLFRPHIKLIAITMYQDKVYLEELIACGFRAFIYKPDIAQKMFQMIDHVLEGKFCFPEEML